MATESYGRTDDGIAWVVYHELFGLWWWSMTLPDGTRIMSPERYTTETYAVAELQAARRRALAGLPPVETMATLRARANAAEAEVARLRADLEQARAATAVAQHDAHQRAVLLQDAAAVVRRMLAEADQLRAELAQARADARLMLHELVALDDSEGTNVLNYRRGLGLTNDECDRLRSAFDQSPPGREEEELATVRRILATKKETP